LIQATNFINFWRICYRPQQQSVQLLRSPFVVVSDFLGSR